MHRCKKCQVIFARANKQALQRYVNQTANYIQYMQFSRLRSCYDVRAKLTFKFQQ